MEKYDFKLPDLGEGLTDAAIVAWHVKVGDQVKLDQILLSVETAKAVVDIPSPVNGMIEKIWGEVGAIITVGKNLLTFALESSSLQRNLNVNNMLLNADDQGMHNFTEDQNIHATPAIRDLAKKLNIDLSKIKPTGRFNNITLDDLKKVAADCNLNKNKFEMQQEDGWEMVSHSTRSMGLAMEKSHNQIVAATIFEDLILPQSNSLINFDITVSLIQAIVFACQQEPRMNSWVLKDEQKNSYKQKIFQEVNLGIAVDSDNELFVPVIKFAEKKTDIELRQELNLLKDKINSKNIGLTDMNAATFILSNLGKFSGKYALPVIVSPMVGILAVGKLRESMVVIAKEPVIRNILPISLSFDHRVITGGQAARFLQAILQFFVI